MFPSFNDLKPLAAYEFLVDFSFYLDYGFINQDEYNQLVEMNKQSIEDAQQRQNQYTAPKNLDTQM